MFVLYSQQYLSLYQLYGVLANSSIMMVKLKELRDACSVFCSVKRKMWIYIAHSRK